MTTQIINPGWLLEVMKHAGKETPEAFDVILHKRNAFDAASATDFSKCSIETDFSNNPMLRHLLELGAMGEDDLPKYFITSSQLQAYRFQLSSITTKLLNIAYIHGAYLCYHRPMADLYTVLVDNRLEERAAKALHKVITSFCHEWRSRTENAKDEETALKIFDEILADPFPGEIAAWAAFCCCWRDFLKTDQVKSLPSEILYRIGTHIKEITAQATDVERTAFNKLIESLRKRKLKTGKTADNAGFIGVIRDLEAKGAKITKISRGRKVFDADKIFKNLKPYTREKPYQFEDYDVFIEEIPDPQGFMDPSIFQITPDLKERRLTADSFRRQILSDLTPF